MDKIHQNLENIEKYLMVAQLENAKMNEGNKSAGTRFRSCIQNITKECAEARRLSLEAKHGLVQPLVVVDEQPVESVPMTMEKAQLMAKPIKQQRGRKPVVKPVLHSSVQAVVT